MGMDSWVDAEFNSKIIARITARDFHFVSSRMFFAKQQQIKSIIEKIQSLEVEIFETKMILDELTFNKPLPKYYIGLVNVRIISPWSSRYYRCLKNTDELFFNLAVAEYNKQIDSNTRKSKMQYLLESINEVKQASITSR